MPFDNLQIQRESGIAVLTIHRPQRLNALDSQTLDQLGAAASALGRDEDVRSVILTGSGDRAFAAGADLREFTDQPPDAARELSVRGQAVFDTIERLGKPVIAAVQGFALGGGCELAMACTFRLAADTARFGLPEVNLGLIPGFAGTQRLTRLVGHARALDLMLTGRQIDAQEALAMGLVTAVVPAAELMARARALAQDLAEKPPLAVRYLLEAVYGGRDLPLADASRLEAALFGLASATEDKREGVQAFLEKRPPEFKGR